jgi:hypothetical protein
MDKLTDLFEILGYPGAGGKVTMFDLTHPAAATTAPSQPYKNGFKTSSKEKERDETECTECAELRTRLEAVTAENKKNRDELLEIKNKEAAFLRTLRELKDSLSVVTTK